MANVLVTGGCGFVGSNLIAMLRMRGHDITILDNFSRGSLGYLDDKLAYTVIEGDIRDEVSVTSAAAGKDAIIHLAAFGSVVESVVSPEENFSVNVGGTLTVLNVARRLGTANVVFASTGGALIGNATPPVNEQSVPRPISPYGASKLAAEGYCCAFANSYDLSVTALRFANVVGPVSWHKKGAVTAFFKALLDDNPISIYGDGSATRDFLYVTDLCHGIIAAMEKRLPGFHVYHLSSGREVSIRKLAETACAVASKPDHPISFYAKRKAEVEHNFADYRMAEADLGFCPVTPLVDAMELTWQWFADFARRQ